MYLGIDDVAAMIRASTMQYQVEINKQKTAAYIHEVIIHGYVDSGFFLLFNRTDQYPVSAMAANSWHYPNPKKVEYNVGMRDLFGFMNVTAGVSAACVASMLRMNLPQYYCMFPEYAVKFMVTPVFTKQVMCNVMLSCNCLDACCDRRNMTLGRRRTYFSPLSLR